MAARWRNNAHNGAPPARGRYAMTWSVTWIALAILLASCAGTGGATDCATWRPILVHNDDTLTQQTARAVLAHNRTGRRLCGW